MRRLAAAISILGLLAVGASSASAASIWTPIASGTTQDITALTYVSDTQAWLGTSGGQILSADGSGAFHVVATFPGSPIEKIAFDPTDVTGYAVALNGHAYRSLNGGATWAEVTLPTIHQYCGSSPPMIAVPALYSVVVPNASTAYLVGGADGTIEPVVLKSVNASAVTPAWADQNYGNPNCKFGSNAYYVTDVAAVAGAPNSLVFVIDFFAGIFSTSDGLATPITRSGEMVNNYGDSPRIVLDPNNSSRIWAVDHSGPSCGRDCFRYSTTGGGGETSMTLHDVPEGINLSLNGVGFAGGTLVAAGDGGQLFTSPDGTNAYQQPADGALAGTRWLSVGVASATQALVGGAGGTLIKSTVANTIPDTTPPTGTINGPSTVAPGAPATFTAALADNAGGSGVDTSSLTWTGTSIATKTGNPVTYTFATPGTYLLNLAFRDLAGNTATISKPVTVREPANPPTRTTSVTDASGAKISFSVPKTCVPAGSTFKVTLSFKKIKKKGATFIKVFQTDFYIGSKIVVHDKKAPFSQRLKVKVGSKSGSKVTVRARAFMKVRHPKHGKFPTKSIRSTVTVC